MTSALNANQQQAPCLKGLNARLLKALSVCLLTVVSGCSFMAQQDSAPAANIDISTIPDASPKPEPLSKHGNPESYVVNGTRYFVRLSSHNYHARGIASWYGTKFHGHRTSNGEIYDMYKMTAAHKTLPLPSYVRVTNLENGRHIVVRVNDRGPFYDKRLIDLSYVAARKLGVTGNGTAQVEIDAIDTTSPPVTADSEQNLVAPTNVAPANAETAATAQAVPTIMATTAATSSSSRQFYLQLGAFSDRNNAENLLSKLLRQTTLSVHISQGDNPQDRLYRVRLGPYPSRAVTQDIESKLDTLGFAGAHIVADEH